eukprot:TRINITY_DN55148_c0_g1_i1.p1 TRINITY_DN55148_c0_g1~~TRINITY_DN55148_c0_g1_i1.p1  ORF type:complete len:206 (+),score=47.12 TRINITY_DN55148_c0_g1_i1:79-618(+)
MAAVKTAGVPVLQHSYSASGNVTMPAASFTRAPSFVAVQPTKQVAYKAASPMLQGQQVRVLPQAQLLGSRRVPVTTTYSAKPRTSQGGLVQTMPMVQKQAQQENLPVQTSPSTPPSQPEQAVDAIDTTREELDAVAKSDQLVVEATCEKEPLTPLKAPDEPAVGCLAQLKGYLSIFRRQ